MEWVCTECDRTYHEAPEYCQLCGNEDLVPADGHPDRFSLSGLHDRLFDPLSAESSLVEFNKTVNLAFAVLVVLSVLLLVTVVIVSLL